MTEFTSIITRWLWRLFPAVWLSFIVDHLLHWALCVLEDDDHWDWLADSRANCAWLGGWLALAEDRLTELVTMRAMALLRRPFYGPRQPYRHCRARAVHTPDQAFERLTRLFIRRSHLKRLIQRRAFKLQRLFQRSEHQLEVIHHPVASTTTIFQIRAATTIPTIFRSDAATTIFCSHPAERIRAPP